MADRAVPLRTPWLLLDSLGRLQIALGTIVWLRGVPEMILAPYPLSILSTAVLLELILAWLLMAGGIALLVRRPGSLTWSCAAVGGFYVQAFMGALITLPAHFGLVGFSAPGRMSPAMQVAVSAHCFQSLLALLFCTAFLWIVLIDLRMHPGRRERWVATLAGAAIVLLLGVTQFLLGSVPRF